MSHLRSISWKQAPREGDSAFPFTVPAIRTLESLDFGPGVTFFVGENGSGKSTLLECIAAAATLPMVGALETAADETLAPQRRLAQALRLTWNQRTRKGFFLRAEDFFGFQKRLAHQQRELRAGLAEVDAALSGASDWSRRLASRPGTGQLRDIARRYGENPDGRSHGEAFLNLFQDRFIAGGLYLLDEPEAALSPQSQLAFLVLLLDMIERNAQFVIATHSPIILAFPEAKIYSFDQVPLRPAAYHDLRHVRLTRDFLNDPDRYLRELGDKG